MPRHAGVIVRNALPPIFAAMVGGLCVWVAGATWPWLEVRLRGTSGEFKELQRRTITFDGALSDTPLRIGKLEGPLSADDWNVVVIQIQALLRDENGASKDSLSGVPLRELVYRMDGPDETRNAIGVIDIIRAKSAQSDELINGSMRRTLGITLKSLNEGAARNMVSWWVRAIIIFVICAASLAIWSLFGKKGSKVAPPRN